ncbi:MAG: outer membrane protein transport protein [Rhodospirillales bacterium]|jgi:long-chain fatty acid transport protein|nr:outer membrane protein transport protein [Rhodospirillales bacterium]
MKTRLIPAAAAVAAAFVPLLLATPAHATNGYLSHGYGIKSMGMAGASIALPQDAIAAAYNPAGMTVVGNRVDFGLNWFRPTGREATIVGSPAPFNNTSYYGDEKSNFFVPEFGYNQMLDARTSVGVSVYGNGGMNTFYDRPFPLFGSTKPGVDLSQLFIAPTVGYKVTPEHAVGVSLNLAFQRFKAHGLENFTAPSGPMQFSAYPSDVTNNGYENSYGYGLRLGYIGQITPQFAVGATYQSKTWMTDFDNYRGLFAEQGGFDIPANYGLGIALKPMPGLDIALDVVWIDYSGIKSINNPLLPNLFQARLGTDGGAGFGWEDMTVYKLGIQYALNPQLTLRGGYNYGKQPIPASETLFNVLAPGVMEDHWTLGATWTLANKSELSFSFLYSPSVTVTGENSIPPAFGGGNVNLKMKEMSFGVAYGWKF